MESLFAQAKYSVSARSYEKNVIHSCVRDVGVVLHVVNIDALVASVQLFTVVVSCIFRCAATNDTSVNTINPAVTTIVCVRFFQSLESTKTYHRYK